MTDQFSIENMKAELARALNKADEDAKTIADLNERMSTIIESVEHLNYTLKSQPDLVDYVNFDANQRNLVGIKKVVGQLYKYLLTNKPNKIDFPLLLQDEAK